MLKKTQVGIFYLTCEMEVHNRFWYVDLRPNKNNDIHYELKKEMGEFISKLEVFGVDIRPSGLKDKYSYNYALNNALELSREYPTTFALSGMEKDAFSHITSKITDEILYIECSFARENGGVMVYYNMFMKHVDTEEV